MSKTIDEVLGEVIESTANYIKLLNEEGGVPFDDVSRYMDAVLEAKQAIAEVIEYVIGEDEIAEMVNYNEGMREDDDTVSRNNLRAEQRNRLAEVLGEKADE